MVLTAILCDSPHIKSLSNVNNISAYVAPDYSADSSLPIFDQRNCKGEI